MLSLAVLIIAVNGTVPQGGEGVPVLEAGDTASLSAGDSLAWLRVVEDEYTVLRVAADRPAELRAYDEAGDILCRADPGQDLLVSAFNYYWFYISAAPEGGGQVAVSVETVPPESIAAGGRAEGAVTRSSMADVYTFLPPGDRRWVVSLDGQSETDLDLEVYGDRMSLLCGSYSAEGRESGSFNAAAGDTITLVVSRYNKAGSGGYVLGVDGKGDFTTLTGSRTGSLGEGRYVERLALDPSPVMRMLTLTGTPAGADADLLLYGRGADPFYSSASYSLEEALLVPASGQRMFCSVRGYDMPDGIRYQLDMTEVPQPQSPPFSTELECGRSGGLASLVAPDSGLYLLEADFHKGRDGDLRLFDSPGEAVAVSQTTKGTEQVLRWMEAGDTLWVQAYVPAGTGGICRLSASRSGPREISGPVRATASGEGWDHYSFLADSGLICAVELDGLSPDADLDLRVTAPGFDRTAEGYLSPADEAGDEAIALYAERTIPVGVTVYTYNPDLEAEYRLGVDRIRSRSLAPADPEVQTWLLAVGISGYTRLADVLNRASMDALDVYRLLTERGTAAPDHSVLLADEMATVEGFVSALGDLVSRAGPEDRLLVFFSGHGVQSPPGTGGPEEDDASDESLSLHDGDLSDDSLAALLRESPADKLLMIDACHSGGFVNDFAPGDDILVVTAAREDLSVSERVLTPFLVEGMEGAADSDADGTVTAMELVGYVDARLARVCPACDALLEPDAVVCPECSTKLVGENAVPRPEQGRFLDEDFPLCGAGPKG
jgi:hypothetical protein